jgi:asparagine synthase (glutamine-hydrolysing)
MCGFTGIVDFNHSVQKHEPFMDFALTDLHRRGPDRQEKWISKENHVYLGFARLAIRDLSAAGNQPMVSDKGDFVMVYNGETYNTDALIQWAGIDIHSLKGSSDTEIILKCFEQKGITETINEMDGIFAMALFHIPTDELYLIRDHAGVKPLYYGINNNGIVFSSTYQHITAHPFFKNETINEDALGNYFKYGYIQEQEGLLTNTYFAPHGHITKINLQTKNRETIPYFNFGATTSDPRKSPDDLYASIVSSQLISDVPIGTFLSGGVDSTLTTGIASKQIPNITAYTIGVNDAKLDETAEAARFASYFNIHHIIHTATEEEVMNMLDQYNDSMGEPLADFSSLLTLKVCEIAKQNLTVVLSGDGGDELFWGYPRFATAASFYPYLRQPKWLRILSIISARLRGKMIPYKLLKYKNFTTYYLDAQGLTGNATWLPQVLKRKTTPQKPYLTRSYPAQPATEEMAMQLAKRIEYDIHMQRVLLKVDRASMYHSLEVRTPLLSKPFVTESLHYRYKECNNGIVDKLPLRKMLQNLLPPHAANSGSKKGFSPPLAEWLRTTLKLKFEERLQDIPDILKPYIHSSGLRTLWENHQNRVQDNTWPIWAAYSLFMWVDHKMYATEKKTSPPKSTV